MQNNRDITLLTPCIDPSGPSPDSTGITLSELIEVHQKALGYVDDMSDVDQGIQAAFVAEGAALENLLQYAPRDIVEVREKSAYFVERLDFLGCEDPRMLMFLRAIM